MARSQINGVKFVFTQSCNVAKSFKIVHHFIRGTQEETLFHSVAFRCIALHCIALHCIVPFSSFVTLRHEAFRLKGPHVVMKHASAFVFFNVDWIS